MVCIRVCIRISAIMLYLVCVNCSSGLACVLSFPHIAKILKKVKRNLYYGAGGTLARLSRAAGMMYPHTMQKPPEPPSDALRGHCVSEWVARLI